MPTPARRAPDSSFNENSPAGIAVNALLMAANAMDFGSKAKDDGDGPSVPPDETNDSEEMAETETHLESVPKTPAESRRSGVETKTEDTRSEQQKIVEVSPDDRFNSRKRSLGAITSDSPLKGTPNLAFIKKKARPLPTSNSKKLERNVSSDDTDDVAAETLGKPPQHPMKASSIQELL
jgi:hypothetical protein